MPDISKYNKTKLYMRMQLKGRVMLPDISVCKCLH